jgi:RNA-directed DNA polymerase
MADDFEWPTFHDLMRAYKSCRLHKPASMSQIRFEARLAENLTKLHTEIHSDRYRPSPAKCFVVTQPSPREIFAANFRDRVVHHLVVSQLAPVWEKKFIDASFACRVGKGSHGAIRHLQKQVRRLSRGGRDPVFVLQLDIEKFFVSIHRPTLCDLLKKDVKCPMLRKLVDALYSHDARVGIKTVGAQSLLQLIPPGKRWFNQAPDKGIPIGNLTSQFGANVYLTALDHYIQRELKPGAYLRYMDDLILLDREQDRLRVLAEPIDRWLQNHRDQRLNPAKTTFCSLADGIAYLGYRLRQTDIPAQPLQVFTEPLKKWRFVGALAALEKLRLPTTFRPHRLAPHLANPKVASEITSINSRIGTLKHANSYKLREKALKKFIANTNINKDLPSEMADHWSPFVIKKGYRSIRFR